MGQDALATLVGFGNGCRFLSEGEVLVANQTNQAHLGTDIHRLAQTLGQAIFHVGTGDDIPFEEAVIEQDLHGMSTQRYRQLGHQVLRGIGLGLQAKGLNGLLAHGVG